MRDFVSNLLTLTIIVGLISSSGHAAKQCIASQSILNSLTDIPLCAKPNAILYGLDNTFPTGSVFVALEPQNYGEYRFIGEIYRFIKEHPEVPIKLNIVVSDRWIDSLEGYLDSETKNIINDIDHVNVIYIDYPFGEIRWTQDWLQFVYSLGKPALFRLTYRGDTEIQKEQKILGREANPSAQVAKACDLPVVNHALFSTPTEQGSLEETMGGNFDVIAGPVWGVGITGRIQNIESGKNAWAYGKPTTWAD